MKTKLTTKSTICIALWGLMLFGIKASAQSYVAPTKAAEKGRSPGVKVKLISGQGATKTYAIIFAPGDEIMSGLNEFAAKYHVASAHFTAIGDVENAKVGWYDKQRKMFKVNAIGQPCEVTSLTGDVAIYNGKPVVHAHINLATSDGIVHGGHLLQAYVGPTLEVMMTVEPATLYKKLNPQFGAALIDVGIK